MPRGNLPSSSWSNRWRRPAPPILAVSIWLLCAPGCAARDIQCSAVSSVSDAAFTLALKEGRTIYQAGEIVALKLTFTASTPHRYWAEDRNYDRSGRLGLESYCVEPDTADPLAGYFGTGGFLGGGLGSTRALDSKPFTAEAELNEWRRLPPGHYRVYAVSQRVWRPPDAREQTPSSRVEEVLRSNTVEFDVSPPDAGWQARQLEIATHLLAGNPPYDDARRAARILRFLDTPDSARSLARLFWGVNAQQPGGWDLLLGLYGSPFPKLAIQAMYAELADPQHPATAEFLNAVVHLQMGSDPAWKTPSFTQADIEPARVFQERRNARTQELTRLVQRKVAEALPRKTGTARALTILGVLSAGEANSVNSAKLRAQLAPVWDELPLESQSEWIQYRWPLIAGPEMLPALRRMVAGTAPPWPTTHSMTRDAALKHIHELDPEAGRALILQDALNPGAQPELKLVELLPAEDISSVVRRALQFLGQDKARNLDFHLIDRFAGPGALPVVQTAFQRHLGKWACEPQTAMLRYFLRVDPEYGAAQVKASLAARKETHCYSSLLRSLEDQLPKAQQIAIDSLQDSDPEVVQDAVEALGLRGSAEAEPALWARLERFQRDWAGREDELRSTPDYQSPGPRAVALEQSLVRAIASGRSWICPPVKLARLAELVSTRQQALQIEAWLRDWNQGQASISPNWGFGGNAAFTVLQYITLSEDELRAKLAQFPSGTQLRWQFWKPGQIHPPVTMERQDALYETMRSYAAGQGVTLIRSNHP
jgi:hypothetical protein